MKTSKAVGFALVLLGILATLGAGTPACGNWDQYDVQFASSECECAVPDGCCCGGDGCCGCSAPSSCGYCYSSPMSDRLMCRMTAMAAQMEASGFIYDADVPQFYQGVASGGFEQEFAYGGKVDQFVILDSGKLGLWQGMTMTMHDEIVALLKDVDYPGLADLCADDVLLDMNLPTWRFQHQGRDEVEGYFEGQLGGLRPMGLRCTNLDSWASDNRVTVESEARFDGDDGEYLWRCIDVSDHADGAITRHAQYCTGCRARSWRRCASASSAFRTRGVVVTDMTPSAQNTMTPRPTPSVSMSS